MSAASKEENLEIEVKKGRVRLQRASISHSAITLLKKNIPEITIPDDAGPMDILALRYIFSSDDIEGNGLYARLQEAQTEWKQSLDAACGALGPYGFTVDELAALSKQKLKNHAETLKRVLQEEGSTSGSASGASVDQER